MHWCLLVNCVDHCVLNLGICERSEVVVQCWVEVVGGLEYFLYFDVEEFVVREVLVL